MAACCRGFFAACCLPAEFYLLFEALERTTVGRSSVLVLHDANLGCGWRAFSHSRRNTHPRRILGLVFAVAGVAIALMRNLGGGEGIVTPQMLAGDLMALAAATGWAIIALIARLSSLSKSAPESNYSIS